MPLVYPSKLTISSLIFIILAITENKIAIKEKENQH